MQRDEIDVMWQQALRDSVKDGEMFTRYHFAEMVAEKTRKELREEIVYTWVPPHFVDLAVEAEREACAKVCDERFEKHPDLSIASGEAGMCAHFIRARGAA